MVKASRHRPVGSFLTRSRRSARPALEALEARLAPAVYTVDRVSDLAGDGSGLTGSLRYCLTQANKVAGSDTIDIATTQPIVLASQLQITDAVTIVGPSPSGRAVIESVGGGGGCSLFGITASAGNVLLANLELTLGSASSLGGAIDNAAGLTLQDCWIHDNYAGETGAGVYTTGHLTVADCLIQSNITNFGGSGAGIFVEGANASFTGTTFQDNEAGSGGGVYAETTGSVMQLDFTNCTFSGNQATSGDGGALITSSQDATLRAGLLDCTFADNSATSGVGGIYASPSEFITTFTYEGSIFANNSTANIGGGGEGSGIFQSLGHNLSTDGSGNLTGPGDMPNTAAGLGSLGFYGGPTPTIPLLAGSPAIDAGTTIGGIGTDQRGLPRPQGSAPDIGAFEVQPDRLVLDTGDVFANVGVAFSRGGSYTGDASASVYVDYGDPASAAPGGGSYIGSGPDFTLSHAYSAEGTYKVTVTLYDSTTGALLDTKQLQVDVFLDGVPTGEVDEKTTSGPGVVTVRATDPGDGSSVTATLLHLSTTNASLLVAIVPDLVAAGLNGSSQIDGSTITSAYDVRAVNVSADDEITVVFHYFNDDFDHPVLRYYNRATGREGVVSTDFYVVDPVAKTITLVLDRGSIPGILDIGGTVFTIAVPIAVSVSPATDPTTATALVGGGGFGQGSGLGTATGGGGAVAAASASFQVTGSQSSVVTASFSALTGPFTDDSFGGRSSAPDRANLLADLPLVPDSLITLPGPILTPGSAESPVPAEPPRPSTPAEGVTPPTSRLDDFGGGAADEAFAHFGDGRLALRLHSLSCWAADGEGADAPADWRDTSLALAAFVAARPAASRRRSSANALAAR